jgi:hypothetical protein
MGAFSFVYTPDGQQVWLPIIPRTWVDAGPTTPGNPLRAHSLIHDASGCIAWHRQRPLFQGFASLAQSIPTGTLTAVTGLSELVDNYAGHSDSTNTGRYYVPNTGSNDWYLCSGYVPFNVTGAAGNVFIAGLRATGGTTMEGGKIPGGAGHAVDTMAIDLLQMNGGSNHYAELMAYQNVGTAQNTLVAGKNPSLTVRWVAVDPASTSFFTPALPAVPHTWTATDIYTGSATGAGKVPLNTELRDYVNFLTNPPIARVTAQGTAQTIPTGSGTWTSVQFPTNTVDTYGGWASGSNTRYTAQRAGLYLIAGLASVAEASPWAGYRAVRLLQTFAAGGTQAYAGWTTLPQTAGGTGTAIYATGLIRMAAGDYVETQMQHTQGAALTLNNLANNSSRMIAVWMAA